MNETTWLTLAGIAATALLGFLGAWSAARNARAASNRNAEIASFKVQLDARDSLIASWRTDAEKLRQIRDTDEARSLHRIDDLSARVDELTERLDALTDWVRVATGLMRAAGVAFPSPPARHTGSPVPPP